MGLIKSTSAPASLTPFSLKDVETHARNMLLKARAQAEQLLAAAQEEGEAIKTAARAEGLAEGKKQGFADGQDAGKQAGLQQALAANSQALTALIESLTKAAADLNATRDELQEQAANSVVQLAVAIARKAAQWRGERDPATLIGNVEAAARMIVESNDVRIAVNPRQRATLNDALPALKMKWPALAHVELIDDEKVSSGGCVIRTRGGIIDADLTAQIDRIAAELLPA